MLKRTVKISLCLLLHVSVQLDHPQEAYAEPCWSYNIVEFISAQCTVQYTHHSLKYLLPQRRISYHITMYFHWSIPQNFSFSKAQHMLPEDGPIGPKHVGANKE